MYRYYLEYTNMYLDTELVTWCVFFPRTPYHAGNGRVAMIPWLQTVLWHIPCTTTQKLGMAYGSL